VATFEPVPEQLPASPRSMRAIVVDRAFPALQQRNFRLFFSGQLVSLIGTWTQQIAQGWLVWTLSHSPLALGVITGVQSAPVLLFGLLGGVAADRFERRVMLLMTQSSAALLALTMGILTALRVVSPAHAYSLYLVAALAFGLGLVNAFDAPARQAFVVELVGKKHLLNAISLNSSIFNGARIIGPAVAGVTIQFFGVTPCFFINAASFIPVVMSIYMIRAPLLRARRSAGSAFANLREAVDYAWHDALARDIFLTVLTNSMLVMSYIALLPLFADHILHQGAPGYSALTVAGALGSVVAALTIAMSSQRIEGRRRRMVLSAIGNSLAVALFALSPYFPVSLLLLAVAGWLGVGFLARANTTLQQAVPDGLRGRVMSIYVLLLMGLAPIAAVQLGTLAHFVGASSALAAEAALSALLITLWNWRPVKLKARA